MDHRTGRRPKWQWIAIYVLSLFAISALRITATEIDQVQVAEKVFFRQQVKCCKCTQGRTPYPSDERRMSLAYNPDTDICNKLRHLEQRTFLMVSVEKGKHYDHRLQLEYY